MWAYERSTQEYLAIKQDLAQPDPVRLAYRDVIKQVVREAVTRGGADPLALIDEAVVAQVAADQRDDVLARYGLRPAEFVAWRRQHGPSTGAAAALGDAVDPAVRKNRS